MTWRFPPPRVSDSFLLSRFCCDALLTVAAAWLLARAALTASASWLEQLLAWGLALLLIVAASGEMLSGAGALGAPGFFAAHAAGLVALAAWRRKSLAADAPALRSLEREAAAQFRAGGVAAWLGGTLLAVLAAFVVLAVLGKPVVYDALTYRLSRIGLWLQDGRIAQFTTDDARLNYMPVAPDLVMAWLLGAHGAGYAWVSLAQTAGGALLLGATAGLARLTGLGRAASLGAAALLLGMANVVPQFTSAYTDLFTAGVFAAAFYLWLAALRRGESSWLGGAGVALAFGSKGTLFYLAPGALLWVAWCGWPARARWPAWRGTLLAGGLAGLVLVGPGLTRNEQTYGALFGPSEAVRVQHGDGPSWRKLQLNLATTLGQLFEPNAQPPGLRDFSLRAGEALARRLPSADRFSFDELDRRANLQKVLRLPAPDADTASCGVLIVAAFVFGSGLALRHRRAPGADLVLVWSGGVGLFALCLYALLQWHPYSFRFWAVVAPWMAVVAAWGVESLPRPARLTGWTIMAFGTAVIFWSGNTRTYQAGWPAAAHPERGLGFTVTAQIRQWVRTLDSTREPLRVALPVNQPLAAFVRLGDARRVELRSLAQLPGTAEAAVSGGDGWLVVPAGHFAGREGRVEKRTWFFFGDEKSPFSLAAYRRASRD